MSLKWKRSFFCKWWCTVKFPYFRWFQVGPYVEIFFIYSCDRILAPEKLILGENNFIFSLLLASAINTHVQTLPTLCLDCHRTYRHVNTHNLFLIGRYTLALTQTQSQPQISCITSLAVPMPVHSEGGTATHSLSLFHIPFLTHTHSHPLNRPSHSVWNSPRGEIQVCSCVQVSPCHGMCRPTDSNYRQKKFSVPRRRGRSDKHCSLPTFDKRTSLAGTMNVYKDIYHIETEWSWRELCC